MKKGPEITGNDPVTSFHDTPAEGAFGKEVVDRQDSYWVPAAVRHHMDHSVTPSNRVLIRRTVLDGFIYFWYFS